MPVLIPILYMLIMCLISLLVAHHLIYGEPPTFFFRMYFKALGGVILFFCVVFLLGALIIARTNRRIAARDTQPICFQGTLRLDSALNPLARDKPTEKPKTHEKPLLEQI